MFLLGNLSTFLIFLLFSISISIELGNAAECKNPPDEVDFHHQYLDYELRKVDRRMAALEARRKKIWALTHPIQANNLDNSIRSVADKKLSLLAKRNVDKQICVVLPKTVFNAAIPYNKAVPELAWIAYEIGRYTKIQAELEKEEKEWKTGFVRHVNLPGIISLYEDIIQSFRIELNELMKELSKQQIAAETEKVEQQ